MSLFGRILAASAGTLAACAVMAAEPVAKGDVYELPKMEVKSSMVCSFGIGVTVALNRTTLAITHVYVDHVAAGSDAESLGLVRGDEILVIDGRKVTNLKGGAKAGSDLFALLVNRPPGTKINLEVAVRAVRRVTLSATSY